MADHGCRSETNGFSCTRPRLHAGRHEARGISGNLLKTWANKRPTPSPTKGTK